MRRTVVVTGASGHIGYNVAKELLSRDIAVILLIRAENRNIRQLKAAGATAHQVDLFQPDSYRRHLDGIDCFFHLAAENTTDTAAEERVLRNTAGLTRAVLDTAVAAGVRTIVYTSSSVVLGRSEDPNRPLNEEAVTRNQESPYVKGKFLAERYCDDIIREGRADIRRLYPSWVVGPGDARLTPPHKVIRDAVLKGQRFYFDGGVSIAAVEEVAKAHVDAWLIGQPNGKYVLGGDNVTFKTFFTTLARLSGQKPPLAFLPKGLIYWGAKVAKALLGGKSPVDPAYVKTVIGSYSWYDSSRAIRELGYRIPAAEITLRAAVREARMRLSGLHDLQENPAATPRRTEYAENDVLLITGFPGWLSARMLDVFMNGDRYGKNAVNRKIRLLALPSFAGMIDLPPRFEIVYGDLRDPESLRQAVRGVSTVYHLAAAIYPRRMQDFHEVNTEGTRNLVDACIAQGVRRILFMGTDSICGYGREQRIFDEHTPARPYKNYGKSKYLAEKYILDKTAEGKIDGTSLRGFWFFGPFMPERNLGFLRMFNWPRQIVFGNGRNYRSLSHVDNTIQAFLKAEKSPATIGKWYWICDSKPDYTVDEIYRAMAAGLGRPFRPLHVPNLICELLSYADSFLGLFGILNPTIHAAGKFHKDIAGFIGAAERDFEYRPDVHLQHIQNEIEALTWH
jgi:dihydroflavonol-4-reductase